MKKTSLLLPRILSGGLLLLSLTGTVFGSQVNVDSLFSEARRIAFEEENREQARQLCQHALEAAPDYHDIRVFLGRLYAWDKQYNRAEEALSYVLSNNQKYTDARYALLDVYIWSEQYHEVLRTANEGLKFNPVNEKFLYSRALAQAELKQRDAAVTTLDKLLQINPSHEQGSSLLEQLREEGRLYKVSADYRLDRFQNAEAPWAFFCTGQDRDPWHLFSVDVSRRMAFGTVIGRINHVQRFGIKGYQFEIDAYPKIRPGTYMYLNLGLSWTDLFPKYRLGGEVFQSLPGAFEASAGFRSMFFENSDVTVYTASVGKYYGSYWLNLRTFVTPKDVSFSRTIILTSRRYFGDADNFLSITVSLGESPDYIITFSEVNYLSARKFTFGGQWRITPLTFADWNLGFANEELTSEQYLKACTVEVGLIRRF